MRRERRATAEGAQTLTYTFHFQISNKGGRQACSVKVQAPNIHDATAFFRQNWPMIESMARDGLVSRTGDDRTIKLAAPALGRQKARPPSQLKGLGGGRDGAGGPVHGQPDVPPSTFSGVPAMECCEGRAFSGTCQGERTAGSELELTRTA
jgi:hypothetical protein